MDKRIKGKIHVGQPIDCYRLLVILTEVLKQKENSTLHVHFPCALLPSHLAYNRRSSNATFKDLHYMCLLEDEYMSAGITLKTCLTRQDLQVNP